MKIKYKVSAYITLEASFIMPLSIMILLITIYFSFYLYNQCVVYQDCYLASLRGSQIMDADSSFVEKKVYEEINKLLDNQVFEYSINPDVNVNLLKVTTKASSEIKLMRFVTEMYKSGNLSTEKEASANRLNPATIVRAFH